MSANKTVLVTGASGFVGQALCKILASRGFYVRTAVRSMNRARLVKDYTLALIEDIGPETDWRTALSGVDTVFHLATWTPPAGVKVPREIVSRELQRVNLEGTQNLIIAATAAGVRRFVFASSVLVYGDATRGEPIDEDTTPCPNDLYGSSKLEVEGVVRDMSRDCRLESVIVRIPFVYGGSERCALGPILRLCSNSIPLPFAAVRNKLSMVYWENLADALILCSEHPLAAGRMFLVRDDEIISTPELIVRISKALGSSSLLFPAPKFLILSFAYVARRQSLISLYLSSNVFDDRRIRRDLEWRPPYSLNEGITKTVAWYKKEFKRGQS